MQLVRGHKYIKLISYFLIYRNVITPTFLSFSGNVILTVEATDEDSGLNGKVHYSIIRGNPEPRVFSIDPETGDITVAKELDYESIKVYNLVIQVL